MFKVQQIDHVELFVPERYDAARWYERTLGLQVLPECEPWAVGGGPLMISSDGGSTKLALFTGQPGPGGSKGAFYRVAFRVTGGGFAEFLRRLPELGLTNSRKEPVTADSVVDHQQAYLDLFRRSVGAPPRSHDLRLRRDRGMAESCESDDRQHSIHLRQRAVGRVWNRVPAGSHEAAQGLRFSVREGGRAQAGGCGDCRRPARGIVRGALQDPGFGALHRRRRPVSAVSRRALHSRPEHRQVSVRRARHQPRKRPPVQPLAFGSAKLHPARAGVERRGGGSRERCDRARSPGTAAR